MAAFRVVLDACVMLPQTLNDLLLTLADAELYAPIWTPDLLTEVERNLRSDKFGKTPQQAARRIAQMRAAFPFAEEEARGYESLIPAMTNDPKDRHVLAAAVRSGAELIVTANLKDFPDSSVEPYDLEVISPDEFLWDLFDLDPEGVFESMQMVVTRNRQPPRTLGELTWSTEMSCSERSWPKPHGCTPEADITGGQPTVQRIPRLVGFNIGCHVRIDGRPVFYVVIVTDVDDKFIIQEVPPEGMRVVGPGEA